MSKVHVKSEACLNCNTPLRPEDNFCPHCGQENNTHKIPLKHILLETFEDFFHFDTKLWNTIRTTFTRPGKITTDYLEGKRARYVPPVKFYIFISFIFFLLLGKLSDHAIENGNNKFKFKQYDEKPGDNKAINELNFNFSVFGKTEFTSAEEYEKFRQRIHEYSDQQIDSLLKSKGEEVTWFNRQMIKKLGRFDFKNKDDIKEITHAIIKSISLTMFIMMPLTAILLLLIFYRKKYYYEHLIFSIHTHTIFFLILSFVLAIHVFISDNFGEKLWIWAFFLCLIYLISSLKHYYKQTWGKTIGKFLMMSVPYFIISTGLTFFAIIYGFLA